MRIEKRQKGDVVVFDVHGKIAIGEGDVRLRETVRAALDAGSRKIVLNMKGVSGMDSAGIGEVIAAHASAIRHGGLLKLAQLSPKVAALLQVTQLIGVVEIHEQEETALASFRV